jgi:hypothetical protein
MKAIGYDILVLIGGLHAFFIIKYWGVNMSECSLCQGPLQTVGGVILFTDSRGIPFEVCDKCEGYIDVLHNSTNEAEIAGALAYISNCEENIEYRGTFEQLLSFVKKEVPAASQQGEDEESDEGEAFIEPATEDSSTIEPETPEPRKKSKFYVNLILAIVLVGLLIAGFAVGGHWFG